MSHGRGFQPARRASFLNCVLSTSSVVRCSGSFTTVVTISHSPLPSGSEKVLKNSVMAAPAPYGTPFEAQGQFEIVGLPPGKYDFMLWHEAAGYLKGIDAVEKVEVKAGQPTDLGALKVDVKDLDDVN